jgi:hypothetical protein
MKKLIQALILAFQDSFLLLSGIPGFRQNMSGCGINLTTHSIVFFADFNLVHALVSIIISSGFVFAHVFVKSMLILANFDMCNELENEEKNGFCKVTVLQLRQRAQIMSKIPLRFDIENRK